MKSIVKHSWPSEAQCTSCRKTVVYYVYNMFVFLKAKSLYRGRRQGFAINKTWRITWILCKSSANYIFNHCLQLLFYPFLPGASFTLQTTEQYDCWPCSTQGNTCVNSATEAPLLNILLTVLFVLSVRRFNLHCISSSTFWNGLPYTLKSGRCTCFLKQCPHSYFLVALWERGLHTLISLYLNTHGYLKCQINSI